MQRMHIWYFAPQAICACFKSNKIFNVRCKSKTFLFSVKATKAYDILNLRLILKAVNHSANFCGLQ